MMTQKVRSADKPAERCGTNSVDRCKGGGLNNRWGVGSGGCGLVGRLASRRGHRQGNNVVRTIYMRCGKESQRINKDDMPTKQHIGAK